MNRVASADMLLERLGVARGMQVLDAGCGPGRVTLPAARRVGPEGSVTALDIQPAVLAHVQQRVEAAGLSNVRTLQAGLGEGRLPAGTFDRALLVTVLGEIPDKQAALAEIFHALKPGGILSITEVLPDPHYQSRKAVTRLAAAVGFKERGFFGNVRAYTMHFARPEASTHPVLSVEDFGAISTTLLVPLYQRAFETHQQEALLRDAKSVELVDRIAYDFSKLQGTLSTRVFTLMRARELDRRVRAFLKAHPDGTVVDIGCGLDTRFSRVDNGSVSWFNLDLPEVVAVRHKLFEHSGRCRELACSALDFAWMDMVRDADKPPYLFVAEGVFPYFVEQEVKRLVLALLARFPGSELVFDGLPSGFIRFSQFHPALRATQARMGWALDDGRQLEAWHPGIRLVDEWFYFDQPEPRLRRFRVLRWFPPVSRTRIVHYQLG